MAALKSCEIAKAINDLSSDSSSEESDFDDILSNSNSISQLSTSDNGNNVEKQRESVRRLPTRRPDPNVSNRNALLARENRRRKKAYVETLEKELDNMKSTNKKLYKLLKKQMKAVRRLEHEKQYYKGLISNQSEMVNLVSVLNTKMSPQSSPKTSSCSPVDRSRSTYNFEPVAMQLDSNANGSELPFEDFFLTDGLTTDFNFFADSLYEPYSETNWDQLLGLNDDHVLPDEECVSNNSGIEGASSVSEEHNYFTSLQSCNEDKGDDSGLCLHITRGKISVEYCPSCHINAKRLNALPDELLVN